MDAWMQGELAEKTGSGLVLRGMTLTLPAGWLTP